MPYDLTDIRHLLELEEQLFETLQSAIEDGSLTDSEIDALSVKYERSLKAVLNHHATSSQDISLKCQFIFKVLRRTYDDDDFLSQMENSLLGDLMAPVSPKL